MKIGLFRAEDCWAARYSGPGSERILEAFQTDTLPTAFTAEAPAETVLATVTNLNPNDEVVLGGRMVFCACDEPVHGSEGCQHVPSPLNNTEHCQTCHLGLCTYASSDSHLTS